MNKASRSTHPEETRSRNWWKISCIGCVGLPCLSLMFAFGWIKCQVGKEGDKLEPELAKLKKMGIPTEPEELNPNPPIPDAENAALLYRQIDEALQKVRSSETQRYVRLIGEYSGAPGDRADYLASLQKHKAVFDLIESLRTKPRIDFKRDYSKGFNIDFPEYSQLRNLTKLLSARGVYWIEQKDYDRALRDLELQYAIANHLSEEPMLIGGLVCIALNAVAHASLDRFLYAIQDNQPMLAKTEAMLARRQKVPSIRNAFYGEMVLGRVAIQSLKSWKDLEMSITGEEPERGSFDRSWDRMTIGDPKVKKMFEARAVAMWREFFESFPKNETDWPAYNKAAQDMERKVEADQSIQNKINQESFPVFSQASSAFAKTDASHRVALLAVKLLRKRPTGLPADLSAYKTLAVDPFDGKPMRYLRQGRGFKVWSIGADLVDNKGTKMVPGVKFTDTDIVLGYGIGFPPPSAKPVSTTGNAGGPTSPIAGEPPPGFGGP